MFGTVTRGAVGETEVPCKNVPMELPATVENTESQRAEDWKYRVKVVFHLSLAPRSLANHA